MTTIRDIQTTYDIVDDARALGFPGWWLRHPDGLPCDRETWSWQDEGWGTMSLDVAAADWITEDGSVDVLLGSATDEPWELRDPYPDYRIGRKRDGSGWWAHRC